MSPLCLTARGWGEARAGGGFPAETAAFDFEGSVGIHPREERGKGIPGRGSSVSRATEVQKFRLGRKLYQVENVMPPEGAGDETEGLRSWS